VKDTAKHILMSSLTQHLCKVLYLELPENTHALREQHCYLDHQHVFVLYYKSNQKTIQIGYKYQHEPTESELS